MFKQEHVQFLYPHRIKSKPMEISCWWKGFLLAEDILCELKGFIFGAIVTRTAVE